MAGLNFFFPARSMCEQREQVLQTFKNLREQIPLLYAVAVVNLIGLHVATSGSELAWVSPVTGLSALLVWRMAFWLFWQQPSDDQRFVRRELIKVVLYTSLLCTGFAVWAQILITKLPDQTMTILLYSILASLGAAYGLASFPRAAILPLIILGLPVSFRLLVTDEASTKGIGISLLLVLLLFMRLLYSHSQALSGLVSSKMAVAREHNRAASAEVAALKRAERDALTGLANRGKLVSQIERTLVRGPSIGGGSVVAIVDLDGFKPANDAFGHAAGDAILKEISRRLADAFGDRALVARMGGDEFAVFWAGGLKREKIEEYGAKICELACKPIEWDEKDIHVGASCGMTEAGPLSTSGGEFLRQADSALYKAKASGKGRWRFYDEALFKTDRRRATLEKLLLDRQTHEELTVEFQPIVSTDTNEIMYAEALARWQNEQLGHVGPNEFITAAEQLGAIGQLNDGLMDKALHGAASWPTQLGLSFNLSTLQISRKGAAAHLLELLKNSAFSPERVLFEVTETAFLADPKTAKKELQALREAGCLIALDDFGAGFTSISYLRELAFDVVKLDGSLITDVLNCPKSQRMLLNLIDLCHSAGARCVAEHVESAEQFSLVKAMGCDFAQGYYLGRATSGGEIAKSAGPSYCPPGVQGFARAVAQG